MTTKSASKSTTKPKAKKAKTETKKTAAKPAAKKASSASKTSAKAKTATEKKAKTTSKKSTKAVTTKKAKSNGNGTEKRSVLIQQTAYFIAEKRGFQGGDPVQDWLAAERQVDEMLKENRA